jgi:putative transposase
VLSRWKTKLSHRGTGFEQPLQPHQHWHIDVSYINVCGTFYYLCSILDGFSRFIVHWDLRESMREADIEVILQRAGEKHPEAKPRIISTMGRSSSLVCSAKTCDGLKVHESRCEWRSRE